MFKRPPFLVSLLIAYSIFLVLIHVPNIIISNHQVSSSLGSIDSIETFGRSYLSYMRGIVSFVFMGTLIYGILSLESWGFVLQILFSILSLIAACFSILGISNPLTSVLINDMNPIPAILWGIFNVYIIIYFFKPEIYKLFLFPSVKRKVFDQDLVYLLKLPSTLSNIADKAKDIFYEDDWREENLVYMHNARVLIDDSLKIADQATLDELKLQIKSNANKIKKLLISSLPKLRDTNIIDSPQYKKYSTFYWSTDQIIETFKMSAVGLCTDKRDVTDKVLKFSKKVEELELLNHTNTLMKQWINNTGSELGSLLKENVEY